MLFVSHSRLDSGRLGNLTDRLKALGIDYWLDSANIPVGEAFVARIGQAFRQSQDFLLVDTPGKPAVVLGIARGGYRSSSPPRTATQADH